MNDWSFTQLCQLAKVNRDTVTTSYIGRLEAGGAAPGIDLVDRLARAVLP